MAAEKPVEGLLIPLPEVLPVASRYLTSVHYAFLDLSLLWGQVVVVIAVVVLGWLQALGVESFDHRFLNSEFLVPPQY